MTISKVNRDLRGQSELFLKALNGAWIQSFDNCREQGYVIVYPSRQAYYSNFFNSGLAGKCLAIAGKLHSDSIVVYHYSKAIRPTNLPDAWREKSDDGIITRFFDDYTGAAEYIKQILICDLRIKD